MSGSSLISRFGLTLKVRRKTAGAYVLGKYQDGAESQFESVMSVQPVTDKERINLTQGQRNKRILKAYTATKLQVSDEETGAAGDIVEFDNTDFEVVRVEQWPAGLQHWKVELAEVNK